MARFAIYASVSALLTYSVIQHAYTTRQQFYPAVIYLVTSKFSVVVLCNMAIILTIALGKGLKSVFLGELRQQEVERVNESLKYTIPELCIALTIFREELNLRVLSLFAMLLFSKFFHVVLDERMNYVETGQGPTTLSKWGHARLVALMWALFLMNAQCLAIFGWILSEQGHSVLILFAFEYCLLELDVLRVGYRYIIHVIGRRIQAAAQAAATAATDRGDAIPAGLFTGEWPNRTLYLMYGKLVLDILKLGVYILYFVLLFTYYGMPIIMVRDLIRAFTDVNRELGNLLASRKLRAQVHRLFKTPTEADLTTHDPTCFCLGDITASAEDLQRAKILDCGHIFHIACLLQWWERNQTCPTCRADIHVMLRAAERRAAAGSRRGTAVPLAAPRPAAVEGSPRAPATAATTATSTPHVSPSPVTGTGTGSGGHSLSAALHVRRGGAGGASTAVAAEGNRAVLRRRAGEGARGLVQDAVLEARAKEDRAREDSGSGSTSNEFTDGSDSYTSSSSPNTDRGKGKRRYKGAAAPAKRSSLSQQLPQQQAAQTVFGQGLAAADAGSGVAGSPGMVYPGYSMPMGMGYPMHPMQGFMGMPMSMGMGMPMSMGMGMSPMGMGMSPMGMGMGMSMGLSPSPMPTAETERPSASAPTPMQEAQARSLEAYQASYMLQQQVAWMQQQQQQTAFMMQQAQFMQQNYAQGQTTIPVTVAPSPTTAQTATHAPTATPDAGPSSDLTAKDGADRHTDAGAEA